MIFKPQNLEVNSLNIETQIKEKMETRKIQQKKEEQRRRKNTVMYANSKILRGDSRLTTYKYGHENKETREVRRKRDKRKKRREEMMYANSKISCGDFPTS